MRYRFVPADEHAAQAWWSSVGGTGTLAPSGQIRAHQSVDGTSHMVVATGDDLLCCTKSPADATGLDSDVSPGWQVAVDLPTPDMALVRVTSADGTATEIRCQGSLADDLIWHDPTGDLPLRLVRALSELSLLTAQRPSWADDLASALESSSTLIAGSASAVNSASRSVQSGRPMSEADVQRLLASDAAMVDALAVLRDLRMRGSLVDHTLTVGSRNLRAFIGEHHPGVADQLLMPVATLRAQSEHDLALLGHAIDQLEATQARTTQLFDRSRYIIDSARESTAAIHGALFAAVGIALTVVQVLALPNVQVPSALNRELPLVIVSSGALAFIVAVALSRRAIGRRRLFWGSIGAGLACPLTILAARLVF